MGRYVNPIVAKRQGYPKTGADLDRENGNRVVAEAAQGRDEAALRAEAEQVRAEAAAARFEREAAKARASEAAELMGGTKEGKQDDVRMREQEESDDAEDGGAAEAGGGRSDVEADPEGDADQDGGDQDGDGPEGKVTSVTF